MFALTFLTFFNSNNIKFNSDLSILLDDTDDELYEYDMNLAFEYLLQRLLKYNIELNFSRCCSISSV